MSRVIVALTTACAALATAGCGALPPEAPVGQASIISGALTTIAAACGESYRLQEFTPHPDLSGLEATAAASAGRLQRIRLGHPRWVYQGETLTQIAGTSITSLNDCSLPRAARVLQVDGSG
jgi:hypothetical protein